MKQLQIYRGKLDAFFETGTEGVLWSLYEHGKEGYEGLQILEEGDYLIVYSSDANHILWSGYIHPDYTINIERSPFNPSYSQPSVLGYWCHWLQCALDPKTWAAFFFSELEATLIKLSNIQLDVYKDNTYPKPIHN